MRTPKHEIKEQGINLPIYHLIISVIPPDLVGGNPYNRFWTSQNDKPTN